MWRMHQLKSILVGDCVYCIVSPYILFYRLMQPIEHLTHKSTSFQQMRKSVQATLKLPKPHRFSFQTSQTEKSANSVHHSKSSPLSLTPHTFQHLFTMKDKVGQGAHGVVYQCSENNTGETYAAKVMLGDDERIRIAKRTYSIMKLFNDESIVKGRELFIDEHKDLIYVVMEYCPYPSLKALLKERKLTYSERKIIIKNILETTLKVNKMGVCHRDLKPDNILVNPDTKEIKLIDFGVSKQIYNRKTSTYQRMWTVTGTIQYKAPEMFAGKAYDLKVDSWAIGIIAYEMMYGRLPFNCEYCAELIEQIMEKQPEYPQLPNPRESTMCSVFIKALLKKEPSTRVNCEEALRSPWISKSTVKRTQSNENMSTMSIQRVDDEISLPLMSQLTINIHTPNYGDVNYKSFEQQIENTRRELVEKWIFEDKGEKEEKQEEQEVFEKIRERSRTEI